MAPRTRGGADRPRGRGRDRRRRGRSRPASSASCGASFRTTTTTPRRSAPRCGSREAGRTASSSARPTGDARVLVAYDSASGAREVLADAALLTPSGAAAPLAVASYAWSADRKRALLFTNTRKVWRENTRGDYWVLDRDGAIAPQARRQTRPKSSLMFAKFSPDGTAGRLRARPQPVRRNARRRSDPSADQRRLADHRQRHLRLGQRGGARHPRRLPLEPRRTLASPSGNSTRPASSRSRSSTTPTPSIRPSRGSRIPRPARPTRRCASASSTPPAARSAGCRRPAIRATPT